MELGKETQIYNILSILKYLESKILGHTQPLQTYWARPRFYKSLLQIFYRTDIQNKRTDLLENRNVELIKSNLFLSEDDIMTLKSLMHIYLKGPTRNIYQLVYTFLLHICYITYRKNVGCCLQENSFILRLPNKEIKNELGSLLFDAVTRQYNFDLKIIENLIYVNDDISESNCNAKVFKTLFHNLYSFMQKPGYYEASENDFETTGTLISILRHNFNGVSSLKF